jgi:hypothetical protein
MQLDGTDADGRTHQTKERIRELGDRLFENTQLEENKEMRTMRNRESLWEKSLDYWGSIVIEGQEWWFECIILATQKAVIGRTGVQGHLELKVRETTSQKK